MSPGEREPATGGFGGRRMAISNIVLAGFMASGKTTVGEILARMTGKRLVDTDKMVEAGAGKTISRLFAEDGETFFRAAERTTVALVSGGSDQVIALGGGAVLDRLNVEEIKERGVVYLLDVSPDEVARRAGAGSGRPLLGAGGVEDIEYLMRKRQSYYLEAADVVIDTTGRSPEEIAREIAADFSRRVPRDGGAR